MNLERIYSTVYTEQIESKKYYPALDKALDGFRPNLTFASIRDSYTHNFTPYVTKDPVTDYLLHLFFEKLLGNTILSLMKTRKNTVFLFPIFQDIQGKSRLSKSIKEIYAPVFDLPKDLVRDPSGNCVMMIPVFSDDPESSDDLKARLITFFNRCYEFILEQKPLPTNVQQKKLPKLESICYTVDSNGDLFTNYYSTKLKSEKGKVLNSALTSFLERLGLNNRSSIKDPLLQLTPDILKRKFKADGFKVDGETESDKFNLFIDFTKKFIDIYNRSNDANYLKTATASDNQDKFKIYYRINNTDSFDDYENIRPGSTYVYKLTDPNGKVNIGYFMKSGRSKTQYIFREYTGLTSQYVNQSKDPLDVDPNKLKAKGNEKGDTKEDDDEDDEENRYTIDTRIVGTTIYYKKVERGNYRQDYKGIVEFFMDLHIYEKYGWFNFRDIDGRLTSETTIKMYQNILFDKHSVKEFLKSKGEYNKDVKLNYSFLKINQSNELLLEYTEFIMEHMDKTNVYKESFFGSNLESFIEKNKRSIVDLIFQKNTILYLTEPTSSKEKTDTTKNYKMVTHQYYDAPNKEASDKKQIERHFEKVLYDLQESKYCDKKRKCELIKEVRPNDGTQYAIVIVDVTKDNIDVDSTLEAKTYCKKIRRTLKRQIQPFLKAYLPRIGGSFTRRRKNRH